jgi:hypothetical protein
VLLQRGRLCLKRSLTSRQLRHCRRVLCLLLLQLGCCRLKGVTLSCGLAADTLQLNTLRLLQAGATGAAGAAG